MIPKAVGIIHLLKLPEWEVWEVIWLQKLNGYAFSN
jgi:hypothetical protein